MRDGLVQICTPLFGLSVETCVRASLTSHAAGLHGALADAASCYDCYRMKVTLEGGNFTKCSFSTVSGPLASASSCVRATQTHPFRCYHRADGGSCWWTRVSLCCGWRDLEPSESVCRWPKHGMPHLFTDRMIIIRSPETNEDLLADTTPRRLK